MTLRVHNTLTRSLEAFVPVEPGKVRMYVCGMTIYDYTHMGHLRMMMAFDVVYRWLRALGFDEAWLKKKLASEKLGSYGDIFLALCESGGEIQFYPKDE